MEFLVQKLLKTQNFSLIYRKEDYSFDIEPHDQTGFTSVMINDLQLEMDFEGRILYVWGLCPLLEYEETDETPDNYIEGSLVLWNQTLIPGISYRVNEKNRWPTYFNKNKSWVCIGDPSTKNKQLIKFAPESIVTLDGRNISALWLHCKVMMD